MIPGLDFGTTNSGAAVFDGRAIRLFPVDPANSNPNLCRTAIYITRSGDYYLGSTALNDQAAWLPVALDDLPTGGPPSARAKYLRRNFKAVALWNSSSSLAMPLALTSHGRMLTLLSPTSSGGRAARLREGEHILGLLTGNVDL